MAVHPVDIVPRGRGRPTDADVEERSPTGRWLHQLEGHVFEIVAACLHGRTARLAWAGHDRLTDEAVRANEAIGRELLSHDDPVVRAWGIRILGNCADYHRADQAEDAEATGLFGLLDEIHATARRIGRWIEKAAAAVRRQRP